MSDEALLALKATANVFKIDCVKYVNGTWPLAHNPAYVQQTPVA